MLKNIDTRQQAALLQKLSVDLMAAWKNADRDAFSQLVHEDFLLVNDTLKNYSVDKPQWMTILFDKFQLVTFNYDFYRTDFHCEGKMAIILSRLSIHTTPHYNTAHRFYLNTDIWTHTSNKADEWKLLLRKSASLNFT
ncbi:MAG TPA: nuclear transport factor 2 family protein [Chitinophagaceae bacterium]|nr:nuclear transport factor 2 family protein [Chitinophagaceae bacterium]